MTTLVSLAAAALLLAAMPAAQSQTTTSPASQTPASQTLPSQTLPSPTLPSQAPAPPAPPVQTAAPASAAPAPVTATGQPVAPAAPPQQSGQPVNDDTFTLKNRVNEVSLVFTVTDKKGRFITGLQKHNFGLLDDGFPPAQVINFTQQTNLPLRIGIMLDTSSSIRTRFKFEQDAAADFFLQVLHQTDRAFIEGFDIDTNVTQDFTNNIDKLNQGIRKLRPGGGTALFDSLYNTCKNEMLTLKDATPARRAIVLVSDGDDNYSRSLESDAIKMCQRAETIVYAISTDTSPTRGHGSDILKTITDATGGQVFYPSRVEDVAVGFRSIEEELRSQYSLEYLPAHFKQDGSFRTIYLQATEDRYHVRVKKGYFATRQPGQ